MSPQGRPKGEFPPGGTARSAQGAPPSAASGAKADFAAGIAVNKAHYPVTVLGPGRRIGIWMQGCSLHCPGCVSQDTWEHDPGRRMPVAALLDWCRTVAPAGPDGVTISGGEPFEQPQALQALLEGLARWREEQSLEFDLLCYSGLRLRQLERLHASILALLDAVIPEPYLEALPTARPWRGSANQPLVPLSEIGRRRYEESSAESSDVAELTGMPRMQVRVDGDRIWYIGIPKRGDMEKLEALCRSRGLDFKSVSWRT